MASISVAPKFVHLRMHSAYSLLEGAIRVKDIVRLCQKNDMPAVAITDSGNLFGALEFSENLAGAGIQPIVGITLAIRAEEREDNSALKHQVKNAQFGSVVLLVQNQTGYANLLKLTSKSFLETDGIEKPHIELDDLKTHSDGLIFLSGGPGGPINSLVLDGRIDDARSLLLRFAEIFPNRCYVELQRHGLPQEVEAEAHLLDFAYENDLPLVATNQPFFCEEDDYLAHDALICIAEGAYVTQEERRRLTPEHRFKSQNEMVALFADLPEAVENTAVIAQRCHFRARLHDPILPSFSEDQDADEAEELRLQAENGLKARLAALPTVEDEKAYWDRLAFELDVITRMEFPGYFLIVSDFIKWAKAHNIPVGPGRGSGAGSVVAWALTITDLDPLRFGLLFERFLNPERVSMPDFDVDFCQDRRDEVIRFVQDKYGHDQVAQIITFGKLQARAVLRDVGRVLQMPYGQVDRLCKLVPNNPANPVTLSEAIEGEPRLQEERDREETVAQLLEISLKLEGLYRHASTHAAGVVIGDRPLDQLVPLYRDPRSDMPVTQFNMKWVEPAGLVKFDFLGLKTLTVLEKAKELLVARGIDIDINNLPLDDRATFEMLSKGDATGVFQLESSGMRKTLRDLKPDCIEDIIALVALYRPGPMDNIPSYIERKRGETEPDYLHTMLEPILKETYGVIIYQEQVMQIAQILSGYSLGEADLLRRAMGKKIKAEMDKQKERFVSGAIENKVEPERAAFIFELVEKFAGYGFNKSHAAAYAFVAYQTAYLKANYPVEFMAATMTLDLGNTDKLNIFRQDVARLEIDLVRPDVNQSETTFSVKDGKIIYALGAIKNVGRQATDSIVEERESNGPFKNLMDFAQRIDPRLVNKRAFEGLAKAGAFDSINPNRAQVIASADILLSHANRHAEDKASAQVSLFGDSADSQPPIPLPVVDDLLPMDRLSEELDAIGFYLSGHPLDDYAASLKRCRVVSYGDLPHHQGEVSSKNARLAGTVIRKRERKSKSGAPMAFAEFSDASGRFEAVVFSDVLGDVRDLLEPGRCVVLGVDVERRDGEVKMRIQSARDIDEVTHQVSDGLRIFLEDQKALPSIQKRLNQPGKGLVSIVVPTEKDSSEVEIELPGGFAVDPRIRAAVKAVVGVAEVEEI